MIESRNLCEKDQKKWRSGWNQRYFSHQHCDVKLEDQYEVIEIICE